MDNKVIPFKLVSSNFENVDKRVLPRFPLSSLIFKPKLEGKAHWNHAMVVRDISATGLQVELMEGDIPFSKGQNLRGDLHWKSAKLNIKVEIKWSADNRMGLAFVENSKKDITKFLSIDNIISGLRPIHELGFEAQIPSNLKYWLMADGPVEIFLWTQKDGDLGKFQIIIFDQYVEWDAEFGLRTGRVLSKRDLETPLISSDEMLFGADSVTHVDKIARAIELINALPPEYLNEMACEYMKTHLV